MQCSRAILSSVPVRPYKILFTLSHKWLDLKKMFLDMKYVFWFSLQLLFETFLVLRRTERDMIMTVRSSPRSAHSCQILMKPEFSRLILKKCSNIKFH
jgi:hypothetical protein